MAREKISKVIKPDAICYFQLGVRGGGGVKLPNEQFFLYLQTQQIEPDNNAERGGFQ